ncbi:MULTISPECIES: outer membrane lipoprotein chaperone LolA [unclassified Cupriavidus]|uniref:outer membrane lipoprotein chaperone LolA n=1 Tax=unclassified Cupriavidus TaxID=2640874 RepID=UPI001C002AEE|nr:MULTISPECIES: outer membrane lipoprotein chaperone LolA [unclassified Cupriavidus]MCA3192990.1 outer membrane lipoprotein chaperone LolA [Cupriavidus sp.]MCA3195842.1 outer membrane lipoprotein chaperone LolA [Cupriavidus sp.]MCA3204743.1 outer membrane lipoprotein chaperone LolA [Cupriavidus sp.]MCA3206875.1 outer membrane lipoprotein chaperone LolA [Cupriavidus sp.]MCA3234752.1 outer membrane lipoprotein chaperone LolA [Cupriavidus sp.]
MRHRILAPLCATLALLAAIPAAHAAATDQLQTFVTSVKTARGEFTQKQIKGQGADAKVSGTSSGTFAFSRPGKFTWRYTKPYDQLLQADGQTLYIYDKDLNQVTERKLDNALGSSPAAILFGSNDLSKNFDVKNGATRDGVEWLELTPKSKDTQFERIGIGFKGGNLEAMELRDAFGNTTMLTFTGIQKNPSLPADTFRFAVPKGADVMKQ